MREIDIAREEKPKMDIRTEILRINRERIIYKVLNVSWIPKQTAKIISNTTTSIHQITRTTITIIEHKEIIIIEVTDDIQNIDSTTMAEGMNIHNCEEGLMI